MSIDVMKQALEALGIGDPWHPTTIAAIKALNAAIEQAQEPVALETVYETIIQWDEGGGKRSRRELARRIVALYTAPRQWQGLTADEIWACNVAPAGHPVTYHISMANQNVLDFAQAIEAKLREKNS